MICWGRSSRNPFPQSGSKLVLPNVTPHALKMPFLAKIFTHPIPLEAKKPPSIEVSCKNLTKVPGYKKLPAIKAKYLQKIISCLSCRQRSLKCRFRELHAILYFLKRSSHVPVVFADLVSFLTEELYKTTKLKLPVLLKACHVLLSRKERMVEKLFFEYSHAFHKFLINASKLGPEKYLLKDIAADTMNEVIEHIYAKDNTKKVSAVPQPTAFSNPQEYSKELYGKIIRCFTIKMIKPDVSPLHWDIFFSDVFAKRMLNCDKAFKKLTIFFENCLYCCVMGDVFEHFQNNCDVSEPYCPLFDLIRNEIMATSYSHANYEVKNNEMPLFPTLLRCCDIKELHKTKNDSSVFQFQLHQDPIDLCLPSSVLECEFFRDPSDVSFEIEIDVEIQMEYYGNLSVETDFFDMCNYAEACDSYVSSQESFLELTSFRDLSPFNSVLTDEDTRTWAYKRKKRPRQKKTTEEILSDAFSVKTSSKPTKKRRTRY